MSTGTVTLPEAVAAIRPALPRVADNWGRLRDLDEADILSAVADLCHQGAVDRDEIVRPQVPMTGDLSGYRIPAASVQLVAARLTAVEIERAHERAIADHQEQQRIAAHEARLDADPWYDNQCRGLA